MPPLNKAPGTTKLTWTQSRILKAHSTIKIKVTKSMFDFFVKTFVGSYFTSFRTKVYF